MTFKLSKVQWILLSIVTLVAIVGLALVFMKVKGVSINLKDFGWSIFWKSLLISVVIILVIFIIFFSIRYLVNRKKEPERKEDVLIKEPVDISPLFEQKGKFHYGLFNKLWIDGTGIPYVNATWLDREPYLVDNEHVLEIKNQKTVPDPSKQTSDRFCFFQIVSRQGRKRGVHINVLGVDWGIDWIRKNWNTYIEENVPGMTGYKPQMKRYPLTSAKSFNERLILKQSEMLEGGYSAEDVALVEKMRIAEQQQHVEEKEEEEQRAPLYPSPVAEQEEQKPTNLEEEQKAYMERNR